MKNSNRKKSMRNRHILLRGRFYRVLAGDPQDLLLAVEVGRESPQLIFLARPRILGGWVWGKDQPNFAIDQFRLYHKLDEIVQGEPIYRQMPSGSGEHSLGRRMAVGRYYPVDISDTDTLLCRFCDSYYKLPPRFRELVVEAYQLDARDLVSR